MKLFLSWSGPKSKAAALALRKWIPDVIQSVQPWMSEVDVDAGARWSRQVEERLKATQFGIICVTETNHSAPWLLFETGALAKAIDGTFVCPYLVDGSDVDLPAGPLTQFQAKRATKNETWELVATINRAQKEGALPEERLQRIFAKHWPDLERDLQKLPPDGVAAGSKRSVEDMVEEILEAVRDLHRRADRDGLSHEPFRLADGTIVGTEALRAAGGIGLQPHYGTTILNRKFLEYFVVPSAGADAEPAPDGEKKSEREKS